jgi:sulfur relay (sulfurtransferase) complex TusBCD TusD component (DsrE family)
MEKMLEVLIKKGVQVKVCGSRITSRGLTIPELVNGVELGSMKILVDWMSRSDEVIAYKPNCLAHAC